MEGRPEAKQFSVLEPYGHDSLHSKFERYWERFKGPFSLSRHRVPRYSVYAEMTYLPVKYTMRRFELTSTLPSLEWIAQNLKDFVRTEFPDRHTLELPDQWPITPSDEIALPDEFLDKFLIASEWPSRMDIASPNENVPEEIANSIYELLCNPKIGSGSNRDNNNSEDFIKRVVPKIKEKDRLLFVLPGFPFKDQNRFRVPFDGGIPDIGEIAFMVRLFNLTQAIYQVHPHAVDIVVMSDGELYRDIFGVSSEMTMAYRKRLLSYRNRLNLQGAVSFICLKELIGRSSEDSRAWEIASSIKESIAGFVASGNEEIVTVFQSLVSGMKWNLDTRTHLKDINDEDCWKIIRMSEKDIGEQHRLLWRETNDRAVSAALEYASINLMLRWTDLVHKFFPDAIRATLHPKPGQFALAGPGNAFPWNGVAACRKWPKNIDDIRSVPYMSLNEFSVVKKVKLESSGLPLFFTAGHMNQNIENAKAVLPREGWKLGDISGREFSMPDLKEFITLGLGDPNFTWERQLQSEDYFTGLFQWRISHYGRYGFGVHGVWLADKLIGQFGLQVLSADRDEVELVIFLGKDHTHKHIGGSLTRFLLDRCAEVGIDEIYGVVRVDNQAAIGLMTKFGWKRIRNIMHFDREGILYSFDVKRG